MKRKFYMIHLKICKDADGIIDYIQDYFKQLPLPDYVKKDLKKGFGRKTLAEIVSYKPQSNDKNNLKGSFEYIPRPEVRGEGDFLAVQPIVYACLDAFIRAESNTICIELNISKLYRELEPQRDILKKIDSELEKNIFSLVNNLNLRHNNVTKGYKHFKKPVADMKKNERYVNLKCLNDSMEFAECLLKERKGVHINQKLFEKLSSEQPERNERLKTLVNEILVNEIK